MSYKNLNTHNNMYVHTVIILSLLTTGAGGIVKRQDDNDDNSPSCPNLDAIRGRDGRDGLTGAPGATGKDRRDGDKGMNVLTKSQNPSLATTITPTGYYSPTWRPRYNGTPCPFYDS